VGKEDKQKTNRKNTQHNSNNNYNYPDFVASCDTWSGTDLYVEHNNISFALYVSIPYSVYTSCLTTWQSGYMLNSPTSLHPMRTQKVQSDFYKNMFWL